MFKTEDIKNSWDGTFHGKPCPEGVYIYHIQAWDYNKKIQEYNGTITLLRK